MRRWLAALILTFTLCGALATPAHACPMCSEANKEEENRPKAYELSIYFMISMPALICTGFGVAIYRVHKKHQMTLEQGQVEPDADGTDLP